MDDFFYANVIFCTLHKTDPICRIPPEELEEGMEPILKECAKVSWYLSLCLYSFIVMRVQVHVGRPCAR